MKNRSVKYSFLILLVSLVLSGCNKCACLEDKITTAQQNIKNMEEQGSSYNPITGGKSYTLDTEFQIIQEQQKIAYWTAKQEKYGCK